MMLHKTRGIVFKTTDYSETSVIAQIFSEKFGLQSYLFHGAKKPRAIIKKNILQPLYLLQMVVYHKSSEGIQRVSELIHKPVFQTIPYDIAKRSLTLFLNEILYKSIRHQAADALLFEFLFHAIQLLDQQKKGLNIFHLYFLLRLTRFLGFYPDTSLAQSADYFDLQNGSYTAQLPSHTWVLKPPYTALWTSLLSCNFSDLEHLHISPVDRQILLDYLLHYYQCHVANLGQIKSCNILKEVLS